MRRPDRAITSWMPCALAVIAFAGCDLDFPPYACSSHAQCADSDRRGWCEAAGHCSFVDESCADSRRRYGSFAPPSLADSCVAAPLGYVSGVIDGVLTEDFAWRGLHAATMGNRAATSVWWNPNLWDARGRTDLTTVELGRFYTDIQRAADDSTDGVPLGDRYVMGGDGSPGVGIIHTSNWALASARLRNPGIIAATEPLVVDFFADRFVTVAHFWEIAITPGDMVVGAEHTLTSGWEPERPEDSVHVLLRGAHLEPCPEADGWDVELTVRSSFAGVITSQPVATLAANPEQRGVLSRWQIRFSPDQVEVRSAEGPDGSLVSRGIVPLSIPWPEVHVHVIGVAFAAATQPDDAACGDTQGLARDLAFRALRVWPVRFERTVVYPRATALAFTPRETGWLSYDLRDLGRTGAVDGIAQPNADRYDHDTAFAFCGDGAAAGCTDPVREKTLDVELPAEALAGLERALLVYDIRGHGGVELQVNGTTVGALPGFATVTAEQSVEWVRRSVELPISALAAGNNSLRFALDGDVRMDRIELELGGSL